MKYTLIFLIILFTQVSAQEKYFIYFTDKGTENINLLNKSSAAYNQAIQELSPKSIERRIKNMGDDFITYEDIPIYKNYIEEVESFGVKIIRKLKWFNSVSAYLDTDKIENLKSLPFIKSIEPVKKYYFEKDEFANTEHQLNKVLDTTYNYGVSLKQMELSDVPIVHSKNINGKNILIGVLDSGFDWKRHNSLKDRNVIAEYDFIFDDSVTANQPEDIAGQDSHGTYVFSVLAGFVDSILIGPAFNASFVLAKTEDIRSETHVEEDNYAAALIWMDSLGVDITTSSLGYNQFDSGYSYTYNDMNGNTTIVTKALELAFQRGISTFTSAGNEGNNSWKYIIAPGDGFNVITVGAVNEFGNVASFSSRGPTSDGRIKPEVAAQGVDTYGAVSGTNNGYRFASGTSAAAPIASGVGGLLLSAFPYLKNTQVRSIFLETSSNSAAPDNEIGYGIISAKNAIEFPNLEYKNGKYILHKTFFENGIDTQSVKMNLDIGSDYIELFPMIKISPCDYILEIPQYSAGNTFKIAFSYVDSLGSLNRIPKNGNYKFSYGSDIISYNLDVITTAVDYEVSNFYPNPFIPFNNDKINLNYLTSGNEKLKIVIVDATGQNVYELNSVTNSNSGFYNFNWNGNSSKGFLCASGVYFASIQIGDKQFGRKFILLK
ncbi:MAG TPA: S8 family serine peptidase [Ignavibacteriaceae bacterium]|nr:S8 family serine peptidase [Ignavibacteriaceae bacterium]